MSMTIDLVKRLRAMAQTGWNPIGDEAADEIERLRARVAGLERALLLIEPSGDFSGWEDKHGCDIGNSMPALAKDGDL